MTDEDQILEGQDPEELLARSRERSQDIDDRYMETDDEKLDFD